MRRAARRCIVERMIGAAVVRRWREVRAPLGALAVAAAVAVSACGGGDDDDAATSATSSLSGAEASAEGVAPASAAPTSAPDAPSVATEGSGEQTPAQSSTEDPDGVDPGAAEPAECPPADAVSAAWGKPVELDEASATTGAVGLVFCPYEEVIEPNTTDQFGLEPIGDFFSITMTDQNPVVDDPTADRVDGLGEQGAWYPGAGELSVWTGDRGVIVSVTFPPEGVDAFALASSLAGLALGVDAGGATATPADPAAVAAAAAEQAAGCPDPAEVSAAVGLELVLAEGALIEEGSGLCPYFAAGDDPYGHTVNIAFTFDTFDPIDPDYPSEDIPGLGDTAVWQDEYHLLWVVAGGRNVTVQVSGTDWSDADERAKAIAVAETLL